MELLSSLTLKKMVIDGMVPKNILYMSINFQHRDGDHTNPNHEILHKIR